MDEDEPRKYSLRHLQPGHRLRLSKGQILWRSTESLFPVGMFNG